MIVKIPFNDWSRSKLQFGLKCCTSRTKIYGELGDTFEVNNSTYRIEYIMRLPLIFVRDYLYREEGANSPEEFEEVWNSIHPSGIKDQSVYVHFFKLL